MPPSERASQLQSKLFEELHRRIQVCPSPAPEAVCVALRLYVWP